MRLFRKTEPEKLMIEILYLSSTLTIGLFAGSLLTEAMIFVPYWRRMEPNEFFRLHGTLGPSLFRYFAPLTSVAVVLSLIAGVVSGASNVPWLISAVLCVAALAIFFIYFRAANNRFARHEISEEELSAELKKWSNWHLVRTTLVVVAFGCSIYGYAMSDIYAQ